jgi:hypothetical protein
MKTIAIPSVLHQYRDMESERAKGGSNPTQRHAKGRNNLTQLEAHHVAAQYTKETK